MIRTVTGDIDRGQLGFTYAHEHLIGSPPPWAAERDPDLVILDEEKAVAETLLAKAAGVRSLYEASAWDYSRAPAVLRRISERTGVQIIGCAGFNKGQWFDDLIADWPVERIEEQMVIDVTTGMDGTDVRGGVIKFGTGYNHVSPAEERVIRAAARAHRRTGAPLHGHTETGTMVLEQIDILREEGVDLRHAGFVHLLRNPDPWLHKEVAATGAYLCYDGFSKIKYFPESTRIDILIAMLEAGYDRQIVIGGDLARRSDLTSYTRGPGLGYIAGRWLPRLRRQLTERHYPPARVEQICSALFVDNPAEYFDMCTPY
jgi:phosphotriesterase-related protein